MKDCGSSLHPICDGVEQGTEKDKSFLKHNKKKKEQQAG
jgi:hypothetical protein